ncbi:MAG: hypothetical protein CMJ65_08955 [Planctomycetaceae bacterium]|nr:hypothetical protein [Planctomycetaceae bacterium]MDP7275976.1 hypothetical protein [Planctomycetaceae bacterium]
MISPTTEELVAFLDEQLPAERMAEIEQALRDDEKLQHRLAGAVRRQNPGQHSVGAIWRRRHLSCPSRAELGSFLLGAATETVAAYLDFHLRVVGCRYCAANLEDLRDASESAASDDTASRRRRKFFQSSVGHLQSD